MKGNSMSEIASELTSKLIIDGTKVGFWRERVEAWARGERIAPVTMDVAWSRRCNAACSFCAAKTQASASPALDIPWDKAREFLDDAAEIGVKGVSLISDGESTLVDYYAESIEYAGKVGIKVGLGTNGIAFDREMLERILPHTAYLRFNFSAGTRKRYSEIMGVKPALYDKVARNIRDAMDIVTTGGLGCNVNMNLVCEPKDSDQLLPFAHLAKELGVHYAVIKHCATDDDGMIKVNYADYDGLEDTFKACEALTDEKTRIVAKWNRIGKAAVRQYTKCYGPPFILQMSGNGLIATCGPYFNEKYKAFHIGNIMRTRFRDIFHSERYREVMAYIGSDEFNPQTRCPPNCLQHLANKFLFDFKEGKVAFPDGPTPPQPEFI
jgi:MoaA/NifB/PqqE/SkfB family radical SAM enzyme